MNKNRKLNEIERGENMWITVVSIEYNSRNYDESANS